jgi:hypothetical protein
MKLFVSYVKAHRGPSTLVTIFTSRLICSNKMCTNAQTELASAATDKLQ